MTRFLIYGLLGVLIWCLLAVTAYIGLNPTGLYNCSLASFHPDFSKEVKKQCREKS